MRAALPEELTRLVVLTAVVALATPRPAWAQLEARLRAVPEATWTTLRGRRIFFAHQSVGANILDGVARWGLRDPHLRLRIAHGRTAEAFVLPGLIETSYGTNGDPIGKLDELRRILANGVGASADIVVAKLCFLDIGEAGSGARVFDRYQATMDELARAYPRVRFVVVTAPLTAEDAPLVRLGKRLLGRRPSRDRNAERSIFNERLRRAYGGSGRVFDLAAAEAGTEAETGAPALDPAITSDGAHLNTTGSEAVAAAFLLVLARVGVPRTAESP